MQISYQITNEDKSRYRICSLHRELLDPLKVIGEWI
nr:MAG TPA: hypothetical protein [Bacteriophage sp.]